MKFILALSVLTAFVALTGSRYAMHSHSNVSSSTLSPEEPTAPAHQFDFWLGKWIVLNVKGDTLGYSHIQSVSDGLGLLEQWTSKGGTSGTSINYYNPADRQWHQHWVGGRGMILHLSGGLSGQRMVLSGHRVTEQGAINDRISWKPLEDGRVEQRWEIKKEDARDWNTVFLGYYHPEGS